MKKNIVLILILMSLCVMGIVGLQLFWNYQNYRTTVKAFDHDINEALGEAVKRETDQRQDLLVKRFKGWLADTTLIKITADHNNRDSSTVFYTQDVHPKFLEDTTRRSPFSISNFKEKLTHITPKAKRYMIDHFGDGILRRDLKAGIVYYYTQMLGDSLEAAYKSSKMNPESIALLFKQELKTKDIYTDFVINPATKTNLYLTKKVNTHLRKPYQKDFVVAGFESPNSYFFKEMRWVIITSLLLISITISCFSYTVRTLLSQHKLAELKDSFINNMTHELNTPIASIKITAEALKAFNHSPETQKDYLDIITYQADKLDVLTSQILNTGRLHHKENEWERIDLNKLITKAIEDLKPQIESCNATINYIASATTACINGDPENLGNVFINLLDNALKYTIAQPAISLVVKIIPDYAEITISDNGMGIPQEFNKAIFERFFRVPQGNLHDVKGFGLGLSYVHEVIKQHNGQIEVSSNYPSGSIFTIKLPVC